MTNTKKTAKRGRGRPTIPVSLNFGSRAFTIDNVQSRYPKVSRAALYNKVMAAVNAKTLKVVAHVPGDGRGHPTYKYQRA